MRANPKPEDMTIWELKVEHRQVLMMARAMPLGSPGRAEQFRRVRVLAREMRRRGYEVRG